VRSVDLDTWSEEHVEVIHFTFSKSHLISKILVFIYLFSLNHMYFYLFCVLFISFLFIFISRHFKDIFN